MRRPQPFIILGLLLLVLPRPAAAQRAAPSGRVASVRPTDAPHALGEYTGVAPGTANLAPRAPAPGSARLLVTWPGFQARPDGASRFFVQTNGPVVTETRSESGRVVILLKDTAIHLRNNRRWLVTRFFNTPVVRARVERRRRDVALILEMRAEVQPRVSTQADDNGYHYVMVEFPPGSYLPEEETEAPVPQPEPTPQGAAPAQSAPSDAAMDVMDNERPPGFGGSGG